jgi:glutamate N-acetyltransferase / amino-acid N-acetyltransferase
MINYIQSGTITSVPGFSAGAIYSGIKTETQLDLGILYCNTPCIAAAVFTTNQIKAAPVIISKNHLSSRTAQAIVVNSGCANACLAEQGLSDALEMAVLTAKKLKINVEDVLVASTGLIGAPLPMDQIRKGINTINIDYQGGHKLAIAMMTTDSKPKEVAIEVLDEKGKYVIGGVTKGAGMIHPQMATMLCFIGTNALVKPDFLQHSLNKAVEISFNLIDVDGDTSTNDCVFLLASGSANNKILDNNNGDVFQKALNEACIYLAKSMVRDAEGATKFIEVTVKGALTESSAKQIARNIASSTLVKTAIFGNDPNWGRIMAVLGMVNTEIIENKVDIYLNNVCVFKEGHPLPFNKENLRTNMFSSHDVQIEVRLNMGKEEAVAWGSDLSEDYVRINSAYST